ncbi:MAG: hypothetical protein Q8N96_00755 [Methylovulum sp.]|nr:hypothetical protein [Methylovulum sp.]
MKHIYVGIISASLGRKDTAYDKDVILATVGSVAKIQAAWAGWTSSWWMNAIWPPAKRPANTGN